MTSKVPQILEIQWERLRKKKIDSPEFWEELDKFYKDCRDFFSGSGREVSPPGSGSNGGKAKPDMFRKLPDPNNPNKQP